MITDKKLKKSYDILLNDIEGETVVLNEKTKKLFTLNPTAKYLFNNCENKTSNEIVDIFFDNLTNKQMLSFTDIKTDCEQTLTQMIETGLIKFCS